MKVRGRDSIDFRKTDIRSLFVGLLIPTLISMIGNSLLNIVDGVIVGRGIGSDALAAVNISAPLYIITSSVAMMFGCGVSVVAAIHLAKDNRKAANINITQSLFCPLILMLATAFCMAFHTEWLNDIFGGSELLLPYVKDYVIWLTPMPVFMYLEIVGTFRLICKVPWEGLTEVSPYAYPKTFITL